MHVHVRVYDDYGFGQHHQPQAPDAEHHLLWMAGEAFLDRDDDQIMEYAFGGHIVIDHFARNKRSNGRNNRSVALPIQ